MRPPSAHQHRRHQSPSLPPCCARGGHRPGRTVKIISASRRYDAGVLTGRERNDVLALGCERQPANLRFRGPDRVSQQVTRTWRSRCGSPRRRREAKWNQPRVTPPLLVGLTFSRRFSWVSAVARSWFRRRSADPCSKWIHPTVATVPSQTNRATGHVRAYSGKPWTVSRGRKRAVVAARRTRALLPAQRSDESSRAVPVETEEASRWGRRESSSPDPTTSGRRRPALTYPRTPRVRHTARGGRTGASCSIGRRAEALFQA
jgi:hypothetical protein